ncbi:Hydantoin utilization protein A [Escovopsis weberi]|uniref:Hydantoin utilization protein A n=1 Tax=Escovopsis weberi TaxID=150374 RepID=A0A0M9VWC7_ESCWE|nr:Hydantoin utilization protein A [Escovopsis weberi]
MSFYRIGVDVGGTNTDAAILDIKALDQPNRGVLASYKAATSPDITSGIELAIREIIKLSGAATSRILSVAIGTTHFINALLEADVRRLDRVAVFRLCGPYSQDLPPFCDFPVGLEKILNGGAHYLDGGLEMDGQEITPINEDQIRKAARDTHKAGIKCIAIVGVFSPLDHQGLQEERCKRIILEEGLGLSVVCSRDIGPTGFLERENATILNAAILRTGHKVKDSFIRAMRRVRLACPLYLSQNDGTLIDAELAADFPIKTFASGPTNSMTGAAFLAGIEELLRPTETQSEKKLGPQVLVVDIGGTTTDICSLLPSGFARQAPGFVEIAGVRTAFSMPDVLSIAVGGGSKIQRDASGVVCVGPSSVGHKLRDEGKIFGGPTLTATCVTAALGKADLGDPDLVSDVPKSILLAANKQIQRMLQELIDKTKISAAPVWVILVGGGALLMSEELKGVDRCIQPIHQAAANAVGAAIAKVSGESDTLEIIGERNEKEILNEACQRAKNIAIERGASPDTVQIVEVTKMPLSYMSQPTMRIQVKAVGSLVIPENMTPLTFQIPIGEEEEDEKQVPEEAEGEKVSIFNPHVPLTRPSRSIDIGAYRPDVRGGIWYISEIDLEFIATGCGILGTGGGGRVHEEQVKAIHALRNGGKGKMRVMSSKALKDTDWTYMGSWYGSPSVFYERLSGGKEISSGIEAIAKLMGKPINAILPDEIGGGNGLCSFITGVLFDIPVLDGDTMGRAFPTIHHTTFNVCNYPLVPCALTDNRNNISVVMDVDYPERLEALLRKTAIVLGLCCAVCPKPQPSSAVKESIVPNTLSQAWFLGRAVSYARRNKTSYLDAIADQSAGKVLYTGKIIDVRRNITHGFTMGSVLIAPLNDEERETFGLRPRGKRKRERCMLVPFQNEFLYAALTDEEGSEEGQEIVCTVPDLISILGQDGEAVGSQDLRYGLRVVVMALPAHPLWKTEKGLRIGGPKGFDLNMDFVGCGEYLPSRSVIEEYDS